MQKKLSLCVLLSSLFIVCYAKSVTIPMHLTNESQTLVGYVTATDTKYGLMLTPNLTGLVPYIPAGVHGFHIHTNSSCANMGMAAGGHLDPTNTKKHLGPYSTYGHLGDLPAVYVNADGTLLLPVVAPRLKVSDILGHSLMIHDGGDNYSDDPKPLGGGGMRMVCGVILTSATK